MDSSRPFNATAHTGTLHHITPTVYAFEYERSPLPSRSTSPEPVTNSLLFVPGLYNTLLTPPYPDTIAQRLPPTWRLARIALRSSGEAWGTRSLKTDVADLRSVVAYFRALHHHATGNAGKVVLMGFSTGCQDLMEYLVDGSHADAQSEAPAATTHPIDAAILQAPVSDREALGLELPAERLAEAVATAQDWVREGRGQDVLPGRLTRAALGPAPVSAARFVSIASPAPAYAGEDDYFSSDLSGERLAATFGRIPRGVRLQVLFSGSDEHVPGWVDKEALVRKWKAVVVERTEGTWDEDSGVVAGARHDVDGEGSAGAVADVSARVVRLLEKVSGSGDIVRPTL